MFWTYRQNNSGGYFDYDEDGISVYVIVEADSADDANGRAKAIGLYWDGYGDCDCCGNRWSAMSSDTWWADKGDAVPSIYNTPVEQVEESWTWMGDRPEGFVHYANGNISSLRVVDGKFQLQTWREVAKPEPTKVYVATSGSYSDYTVEGVFRNKEDAEAYALADDLLEFVLMDGPADVRPYYMATWNERSGDWTNSFDQLYDGNDEVVVQDGTDYLSNPWIRVTGWDKERVLKALGDRKAALVAEKAGIV
jgi:hypothetical protein